MASQSYQPRDSHQPHGCAILRHISTQSESSARNLTTTKTTAREERQVSQQIPFPCSNSTSLEAVLLVLAGRQRTLSPLSTTLASRNPIAFFPSILPTSPITSLLVLYSSNLGIGNLR